MASTLHTCTGGTLRVLSGGAPTIGKPTAPSVVAITAGNGQISVQWSSSTSDGGSPITGYSVVVTPAGGVGMTPIAVSAATRTATQTGLVNGVSYTATVTATNVQGSRISAPSAPAKPTGAPRPRPTAASTGYPHGLAGDTRTPVTLSPPPAGTTVSGSQYRLTTPNVHYDGIDWDRGVAIQANGITFSNCRFRAPTAVYLVAMSLTPFTGLSFTDCEFDGGGTWADTWGGSGATGYAPASAVRIFGNAAGAGYTMTRCHLHNLTHCVDADSNTSYYDCFMGNPIKWFDAAGRVSHNDIVQFALTGANNVAFSNCVLDNFNYDVGKTGNTAAIQWGHFSAGATLHNVIIDGCYLNGGGYTTNSMGRASDIGTYVDVVGMQFTNNRFGLYCDYSATTNPSHDPRITWSGNVYDVSGTTNLFAKATQVLAGQEIP